MVAVESFSKTVVFNSGKCGVSTEKRVQRQQHIQVLSQYQRRTKAPPMIVASLCFFILVSLSFFDTTHVFAMPAQQQQHQKLASSAVSGSPSSRGGVTQNQALPLVYGSLQEALAAEAAEQAAEDRADQLADQLELARAVQQLVSEQQLLEQVTQQQAMVQSLQQPEIVYLSNPYVYQQQQQKLPVSAAATTRSGIQKKWSRFEPSIRFY